MSHWDHQRGHEDFGTWLIGIINMESWVVRYAQHMIDSHFQRFQGIDRSRELSMHVSRWISMTSIIIALH